MGAHFGLFVNGKLLRTSHIDSTTSGSSHDKIGPTLNDKLLLEQSTMLHSRHSKTIEILNQFAPIPPLTNLASSEIYSQPQNNGQHVEQLGVVAKPKVKPFPSTQGVSAGGSGRQV